MVPLGGPYVRFGRFPQAGEVGEGGVPEPGLADMASGRIAHLLR